VIIGQDGLGIIISIFSFSFLFTVISKLSPGRGRSLLYCRQRIWHGKLAQATTTPQHINPLAKIFEVSLLSDSMIPASSHGLGQFVSDHVL
jgi:hypothetical protein